MDMDGVVLAQSTIRATMERMKYNYTVWEMLLPICGTWHAQL